jgi:hypothetical protein
MPNSKVFNSSSIGISRTSEDGTKDGVFFFFSFLDSSSLKPRVNLSIVLAKFGTALFIMLSNFPLWVREAFPNWNSTFPCPTF